MREIITLQCNDCKNRNYTTTKTRKSITDRMETKSSAIRAGSTRRTTK